MTNNPPTGPILCIGLTPALQRTLTFDEIQLGEVNRARSIAFSAAGKGVNVALVLKHLGADPLLVGFLGGETGKMLATELEDASVACDWVPAADPTRSCHTLIETGSSRATELVEEMAHPSPEEWAELERRLDASMPSASFVVLSGKLPPGSTNDVYANIVRRANEHGTRCLIDSQGAPLLEALRHQPFFVKLNTHELGVTLDRPADSVDALADLMQEVRRLGASWVMVTQGPETALLLGEDGLVTFHPPEIDVVNPIGSGDAVAAGIAHALLEGQGVAEAAAHGLACGTAAALESIPGLVDRGKVAEMLPLVGREGPRR